MPPDDDLFPADDTPAEGEPAATAKPAASLTHDDVAGYTQQLETMGQTQAELQQNQAVIAQALQGVNQTLARLGLNPDGTNDGSGEFDAAAFLSDPEASVREVAARVADERLREQAGPLLGQLVEQTHQAVMAQEKASISGEFGAEAWDKVFAPAMDPILQRTRQSAPSQLGNTEAIRRAINSIKGEQFAALSDMRKTAKENADSQAEEAQRRTLELVKSNLTHPIQRTSNVQSVTPEMKAHLDAEERQTGVRPDEKAILRSLSTGPTLSDYLKAKGS